MVQQCGNCNAALGGSAFRSANELKSPEKVAFVNYITRSNYPQLCGKCGGPPLDQAYEAIDAELDRQIEFVQSHISYFPMFSTAWLPPSIDVRLMPMITANVTVGTGIFNEWSQGLSDLIGAVNTSSGMSLKVNKGEATARSILVSKARDAKANCIISVDIDYGFTGNNAATINMQGTPASIRNLDSLMEPKDIENAGRLEQAFVRIAQLRRWRTGDISPD